MVARELYDHRTDPAEDRNVAADAANREVMTELSRRLTDGWRANVPPK